MGADTTDLKGPDLRAGIPLTDLTEDIPFGGHDGSEAVVLVLQAGQVYALGGTCTHYGAPLAEGIVSRNCLHCPWHHTAFELDSGNVVRPPAFNPLPRWRTSIENGVVRIHEKLDAKPEEKIAAKTPTSVAIIGAGAAGMYAADTLRRHGYEGTIDLIDPDKDAPYDRPNLSKDYLAGNAPDEWMTLRDAGYYRDQRINRIARKVESIDVAYKKLRMDDGSDLTYGSLLLATGSVPVRPPIPGADKAHVHVLRSWKHARDLIADVAKGKRVVIAGASFIGMEAAASLRARECDVTIVAPESVPFEKVFGRELGEHLKQKHEEHGVSFKPGRTIAEISDTSVKLDDGSVVDADVILIGIGVKPLTQLAQDAGITVNNGVVVDQYLETNIPGVFAAGDIASYPGDDGAWRIEHWEVAQHQGKTAARNILGAKEPFTAIPFFWTAQYDVTVSYVGHAVGWNKSEMEANADRSEVRVTYAKDGRVQAVATINKDKDSLRAELAMDLNQRVK